MKRVGNINQFTKSCRDASRERAREGARGEVGFARSRDGTRSFLPPGAGPSIDLGGGVGRRDLQPEQAALQRSGRCLQKGSTGDGARTHDLTLFSVLGSVRSIQLLALGALSYTRVTVDRRKIDEGFPNVYSTIKTVGVRPTSEPELVRGSASSPTTH